MILSHAEILARRSTVLRRRQHFSAFGDAWTDWCGGNWTRYYSSQGQCEKGANGKGYEVLMNPPWTAVGVTVRGGDWMKKGAEIVTPIIAPAPPPPVALVNVDVKPVNAEVQFFDPIGTITGSNGASSSTRALYIGGALLALGAIFMVMRKKGKSSFAGYYRRKRGTSLKRAR